MLTELEARTLFSALVNAINENVTDHATRVKIQAAFARIIGRTVPEIPVGEPRALLPRSDDGIIDAELTGL